MKHAGWGSVVLIIVLASSVAWAQLASGTINGIVTDPQGAVLPNAKVVLTSKATGLQREASTAADGSYVFP